MYSEDWEQLVWGKETELWSKLDPYSHSGSCPHQLGDLQNKCNLSENSERDGNTRPPDLPLEKPVYKSGNNS